MNDDLLTFPISNYDQGNEIITGFIRVGINSKYQTPEWHLEELKKFFEKPDPRIKIFVQLLSEEKKFVLFSKQIN